MWSESPRVDAWPQALAAWTESVEPSYCLAWRMVLDCQRVWVYIASVLALGCARPASAPRPNPVNEPTHVKSAPATSAGANAESESAPEPERFPPEPDPTWPDKTYGGDAVLAPVPRSCKMIARRAKAHCAAGGDPVAVLAAALGPSASTGYMPAPWIERARLSQRPVDPEDSKPLLERDARLWELEACPHFPAGFIHQLRAELFVQCAPTIAQLGSEKTEALPTRAQATLQALTFAARLRRFELHARKPLVGRVTRKVADQYVERYLGPWLAEHVNWLRLQEAVPAQFAERSYARALAIWALARAWGRLGSAPPLRPTHLDRELLRHYELRTRFYGAIDAATQELRGDEAEVFRQALHAVAWQGTVRPHWSHAWLWEAVAPAAKSRKRSSPLFYLLLPRLELAAQPTSLQVLLERLPPYYAAQLVSSDDDLNDPATLASLLVEGLAPESRQKLQMRASPEGLRALAQLRTRLGILTHHRQQFAWAHEHLRSLAQSAEHGTSSLLGGLVDTLRRGPFDAAGWQHHTVPVFDTASLALVAQNGPSRLERGMAHADLGELMWAGNAPLSQLRSGVRELGEAQRILAGTPYENCVEQSVDDKRDTWKPFDVGTPCEEYRRVQKRRGKRKRVHGTETARARLYYPDCRLLSWQYQRIREKRGTLDEVCP